jgi:hypothetical protein
MATPPTFSSGAVLTAAQMNTVGLWLIKTQTVGTGVASVSVTGAFSGDYNNYKIIYEGGRSSVSATVMQMSLGGIGTASYYSSGMQQLVTAAAVVTSNYSGLVAWILGYSGNNAMRFDMELSNPNAVGSGKLMNTKYASYDSTNSYGGTASHVLISSAATTSFTIAANTGTLTGGTVYVYGYKGAI